jgi:thiol-disulfide isomerase/thioredoxin
VWCRAEFPRLQEVLDKYKAQGLAVVTINVEIKEQEGAVKIMSGYGFTALKGSDKGFSWANKMYGVQGTPTSFLLDPDGKIVFKVEGLESLESEKACETEVEGLLKWSASNNSTPGQEKISQ